MSATTNDAWTTRRLLTWTTGYLEQRGVDSPRVVAEMLLAHVLECERLRLYMEVDRAASTGELDRYRAIVAAAGRHEPVQYLVGEASFYWRSFPVDDSTLIPQPCTEVLVDHVLDWLRDRGAMVRRPPTDETDGVSTDEGTAGAEPPESAKGPRLADIGTGSGCIAVSLAAQVPAATVLATDVLAEALELARRSADRHRVADRVELRTGDGLAPLLDDVASTGRRFDVLASNPPYIPANEHDQMDEAVRRHVPASAWSGGDDGLDVIRPIVAGAHEVLAPGGLLAVEIASSQRDAALSLVNSNPGLVDGTVEKDQDGLWRVLLARAEG